MKKNTKATLRGVGSVIDIFPRSDFRQYIPSSDATERMSEHWQRVGDYIRRATERFRNEQTSESSEASR